jgi:TRAP transporter TAXI family solute receptor
MRNRIAPGAAFALALGFAFAVGAQDTKLPSTLTITAYDTGSSGFNIAVAVGKTLKDKHGADVRVLPAGNDVARLMPLRTNRANFSAMGIGGYFASEAVFEFAVKDWGPQKLRLMLASTHCNAIGLGVAKDAGVKEIKDLKGKRVGIVVGSPALNQNAFAILAFAGLTKNDVKLVEFSSYGAMWKGMLNNEVDAAIASNISGQTKEVETSPRGLVYPPLPHSDAAGWARLHKIGPYFLKHKITCGGALVSNPQEGSSYPYPIFMAYDTVDAGLIHGITKAMITGYADYKDAAPGAAGLDVKLQNRQWVLPYHAGAVKALKEAGAWSDADEAYNNKLIKRQDTLAAAWSAFLKANPPEDKAAFTKAWMEARKAALAKVGMDAIFE